MPNYHSLEEFSITKAYANWWIGVCNLKKNMLSIACIEPPHDSSLQIPSKSLESRTCKINPSVSTKSNVGDNIEGNFDNLPNDSRVSSKHSMGGHQTNVFTHLEHEGIIFYGGNAHYHQTFKQINNAEVLHVSSDGSKDISECHFKHRKTRPSLMYYDETNSHADVFFADAPSSTQPMELSGEKVFCVCFFF